MPQKYSPNLLKDIRLAFKDAPPPKTPEEITGRKIVEEMFDDITVLRDQGHTFESISEILKTVNVELSPSTLAGYYRDEIKARRARERRARKAERERAQVNGTQQDQTVSLSSSNLDQISVVLEDDDYDEIQ